MVVTTLGKTFKRRVLERDPSATSSAHNNQLPFNFDPLETVVTVENEQLDPSTRLLFENHKAVGYALSEDSGQWLKASERVILRIQPEHFHGVIRAA